MNYDANGSPVEVYGAVPCDRFGGGLYNPKLLDYQCHLCGHGQKFHRPTSEQPEPRKNDRPAVWDLVIDDMGQRDYTGFRRYGTRLQPHNGRSALRDAYEEALDLAVYLRQELFEREGK